MSEQNLPAEVNPEDACNVLLEDTANRCVLANNQELIWLGQRLAPQTPLYEVIYTYSISGDIAPDTFQVAFRQMVENVATLRTVASDADWKQALVQDSVAVECEYVDLSQESDPATAANQFVDQRLQSKLNPELALYYSALLKLGAQKFLWYLKLHHTLTDATNGSVMLQTLSEYYTAVSEDTAVTSTWQYAAFVDYEAKSRQEIANTQHNDWWGQRSKVNEPTRFYRAQAASESYLHHREVVPLSIEETSRLDALAKNTPFRQLTPAMSLFNIFATALTAWLYRLEVRDEISIGATHHGRVTPQFRKTAGLFMQLLPFQVCIEAADTFETLSSKVTKEAAGFLKEGAPGVMTPALQKTFDVALNVIDLSVGDFAGMPTQMDWLHNGYGDASRKLTLSVHRNSESGLVELLFDFSTEAFTPAEQARAIAHFKNLLRQMCEAPKAHISAIDFLTDTERSFFKESLGQYNEHPWADVWERFSEIADQYPNEPAIMGIRSDFTYRQLEQAADTLREAIDTQGCGDVVPLLCRRDEQAVLGMLSILCSGRCFLPIDTDLPQARIEQLLQDSGANWMLDVCSEPKLVAVKGRSVSSTCECAKEGCYVLYTSGSTGKPNGVVVRHASLINLLEAFEALAPIARVNCSWWTNVGFDVAIYGVFSALLYGRKLCIPNERVRTSPEVLCAWLVEHQIGSAYLPPFFLADFDAFLKTEPGCALRRLLVGVEPIPQRLLASIATQLPDLYLINGYGPTEATVCATLHLVDRNDISDTPASIGTAVKGNQLRIVDSHNQTTPQGVPGELLIGGAGLALGYLGNPELTAKRFVHEACDGVPVWYRTGDRVVLREDGGLQFLGRIDEQVKVKGHRIEPAEITAAIRSHENVHECAVIVSDEVPLELWAFYTVKGSVVVAELRSHLQARLPRYMIPAKLLAIDALPRTQNGKLDRKGLLSIARESANEPRTVVQPSTALESALLEIWQSVFEGVGFGITDNFFDLGGDSIDATQIAALAEKQGLRLAPALLFEHQTIEALAIVLSVEESSRTEVLIAPEPLVQTQLPTALIEKGFTEKDVAAAYELSPVQEGMLFHSLSAQETGVYVAQVTCRLTGRLDTVAFKAAWQRIFERHPVLRTCFVWEGMSKPMQVVMQSVEIPWQVDDWRNMPSAEQDSKFKDVLKADRARGFDLKQAPIVRFRLVQEADTTWRLLWSSHHLLLDGLSTLSILREVWQELESAHKEISVLLEEAVPFQHYITWLKQQNVGALEVFWRNELRDYEEPVDLVIQGGEHAAGHQRLERQVEVGVSQRLRSFAAEHRLTLNSLIQGAWALLLNAYTGKDDVVFGSTVSGRPSTLPNADKVIGCCINTLPLRVQIDSDASPIAWLGKVQQRLLAIREFEYTSLQSIQKWSDVPATRSLFENIVVFESYSAELASPTGECSFSMSDLELWDQSNYPLVLLVYPNEEQLRYTFIYDNQQYSAAAIERLLEHLLVVLTSLVDPDVKCLADVQLLTDEEHKQLSLWTQSPAPKQVSGSVLEMIEAKTRECPKSPAVIYEGAEFSYVQLAERSEQLAAQLVELGVNPGGRVALCLERSFEMVVGILGILKAGAAYVPIAPKFPELRQQQMMETAGVRAIVTRQSAGVKFVLNVALVEKEDRALDTDSADLAYIIFTSGSTGKPKLVGVTHANLAYSTAARIDYYSDPVGRFLLLSTFTFDSSVAGIFWTLCSGGALVLPKDGDEQAIETVNMLIADNQVTHTLCLPSVLAMLIQYSTAESLQSLRTAIVAGETCPSQLANELFAVLPNCQLYNEYGPTEATVWCSVFKLESQRSQTPVPIGKPIPGAQIYILNEQGEPMPIGVPGEICVAGPGVVEGYLGQPTLSEARFQENPIVGKIYRTGDLGYWQETGQLQFLGRADGQIKIRGYRIELGEIEAALQEHASVGSAVVLADRAEVDSSVDALVAALERLDETEAEQILKEMTT